MGRSKGMSRADFLASRSSTVSVPPSAPTWATPGPAIAEPHRTLPASADAATACASPSSKRRPSPRMPAMSLTVSRSPTRRCRPLCRRLRHRRHRLRLLHEDCRDPCTNGDPAGSVSGSGGTTWGRAAPHGVRGGTASGGVTGHRRRDRIVGWRHGLGRRARHRRCRRVCGAAASAPCADLNQNATSDCTETSVTNSDFATNGSFWIVEYGMQASWLPGPGGDALGKAARAVCGGQPGRRRRRWHHDGRRPAVHPGHGSTYQAWPTSSFPRAREMARRASRSAILRETVMARRIAR